MPDLDPPHHRDSFVLTLYKFMKSSSILFSIATTIFLLSTSCKYGIEDYRIKIPYTVDVLGKNIENFKKDMSEAKLVYSGDEFTDRYERIDKTFEWEFLPGKKRSEEFMDFASDIGVDIEDTRSERIFEKVRLVARIDRTGRIVSVRLKRIFKDVDTFRNYYKLRLASINESTETDDLACFNVEPSLLGSDDADKFYLDEERISEWKYVKKCEQSGWKNRNKKGQGEITRLTLTLDTDRKPKKRNKENKGERYVIEDARFMGYM